MSGKWKSMAGDYETLRADLQFPLLLVPKDTPDRNEALLALLNGFLAEFGIWITHIEVMKEADERDQAVATVAE